MSVLASIEVLRPEEDPHIARQAASLILSEVYPEASDVDIQMRFMLDRFTVVAVDSSQNVLATAALLHPGPVPENTVMDVATSSTNRKQGLGRKVMDELEQKARDAGTTTLYLHSPEPTAIPFYERLGYQLAPDDTLVKFL